MNAHTERAVIHTRISEAASATVHEAAALAGMTADQFVEQAVLKEAERVIDREKNIYLSNDDAKMLLDLLENPPSPNAALTKAFERFMTVKHGIASDPVE